MYIMHNCEQGNGGKTAEMAIRRLWMICMEVNQ